MKKWRWLVAIVFITHGTTQAALLLGWDIAGIEVDEGIGLETNEVPYTFFSTTNTAVELDAYLTLSENVNPSTGVDQYGFKIPRTDLTNSLAGAVDSGHYLEITLVIEDGHFLNLDSLEMKGQSSATGCSNLVIMSSIDGFVVGNELGAVNSANIGAGGFDTDASGFGAPIDLSDAKFQNLTGEVSFRLYGWNSSSGAGVSYIRNLSGNDLEIYGELVGQRSGNLTLVMEMSNDWINVQADFDGAATTNYVLQTSTNLASNVWNSVTGSFNSDTNWSFSLTNTATFFRAAEE